MSLVGLVLERCNTGSSQRHHISCQHLVPPNNPSVLSTAGFGLLTIIAMQVALRIARQFSNIASHWLTSVVLANQRLFAWPQLNFILFYFNVFLLYYSTLCYQPILKLIRSYVTLKTVLVISERFDTWWSKCRQINDQNTATLARASLSRWLLNTVRCSLGNLFFSMIAHLVLVLWYSAVIFTY